MENATKALLISASILIVIVLIAIGIRILNSTSGVTDQVGSTSSALETSMFNSQFEQFFGSSVPGTQVRSMISKIIVNNSQTPEYKIMLVLRDSSGNELYSAHNGGNPSITRIQDIYNLISNSKFYAVYVTSGCTVYANGYNNGHIACITIKEKA